MMKLNNVVSLNDYKNNRLNQEQEKNINLFTDYVDNLIQSVRLEETDEYRQEFIERIIQDSPPVSNSRATLISSYYSLINEDRKDLADLVFEILKMM